MSRFRVVLALAAALTVLAGCGAGQEAATAEQRTNAGGANGEVGEMAVEHVSVRFGDQPVPAGQVYAVGEAAPLRFTLVNTGREADRLVAITSPVAASVAVSGETRIPGGQALVAGSGDFPATVTLPDAAETTAVLRELTTPLRAGLTYPVTFTFERAGDLTMAVPLGYPDNLPLPPRAGPPDPGNLDEPIDEAEVPEPAERPEEPR